MREENKKSIRKLPEPRHRYVINSFIESITGFAATIRGKTVHYAFFYKAII